MPSGAVNQLIEELKRRSNLAEHEIQRELDLPATLLVGAQRDLFAEVDRLRGLTT